MERPGSASLMLNQAYSERWRPRKTAFLGLPVRISPGTTVTTLMPSAATSARNP
jgi:hypothetical protein